MHYLPMVLIFFLSHFTVAQVSESILNTKLISSTELEADELIRIDEFDNLYYLKNNILYKNNKKETLSYTNTQLGKITSVDIKNPFKIVVFYGGFNTIILLDNKLNELTDRIDYNASPFSKNISFVSGSSNNNLWLYSSDDNTLHLYNYKTEEIQFISQSLSFNQSGFQAKKLVSSYKNCWLIGENNILQFNEYGTLLKEIQISNVADIGLLNDNFVYLKNNKLYKYDSDEVTLIKLEKEISIESFYVNKNEIYIFDGTTIFVFSFIKI